jgi:hypothetical protein
MAIGLTTTGILTGSPGLSTDGILFGGYGFAMTGVDVDTVGDDGGWKVIVSGVFPLTQGMYVDVYDPTTGIQRACNSGKPGDREVIRSTDGGTLTIYVPAMPIGGAYDLVGETEDGIFSSTLTGVLTFIHRSFATNLYSLRSAWPPPRDVGPYSIEDED